MAIDASRILTISFRDYADSLGRPLTYYEPAGVHCRRYDIGDFAKSVPDAAEVVVDYDV